MIKINTYNYKLIFRETFVITYESVSEADVIIIKLVDEKGNIGWGNICPDTEVTGETINQVNKTLTTKFNSGFFTRPIDDWYYYHLKIQKEFYGMPATQSGIEEAILNLFTSSHNISLCNLFGGYKRSCPIMISLGIKPIDKTLSDVKKYIKQKYKIIKLKVGLNLDDDIQKVNAVSQVLPTDVKLAIDANQGYNFLQAHKFIKNTDNSKIAFFEQPTDKTDFASLKKLKRLNKIPIFADESVTTIESAIKLLSQDYIDGINIKLIKCGGPINFVKIFYLAQQYHKKIMIGCTYETNISMTTGASLALALPLDYADLDSGHLDFINDPTNGGAFVKNGEISIGDKIKLNLD